MDIGQKLKTARSQAGLTQETAAEAVGVSRQTISNWENNRSYPDIVSVLRLSDLYEVSLDGLLKEDKGMIQYLEDSTNQVKSRQKFSKLIQVTSYLVIWAVSVLFFWLGADPSDAMAYALLVFWLVLPVTTFVISVFIGKDDGWAHSKWLMLLFFGVMYMLAEWGTFSLANGLAFDKTGLPDLTAMLPGLLCSAAGLGAGTLFRAVKHRKNDP